MVVGYFTRYMSNSKRSEHLFLFRKNKSLEYTTSLLNHSTITISIINFLQRPGIIYQLNIKGTID